MGFKISDLIIESVIRDGLTAIRKDPSIIDDVFSQLKSLSPLMDKKYGDKEVNRIKEFFQTKEVHIVQSFSQVVASMPCVSIQLLDNTESIKSAHLDDFEADVQTTITDQEKLAGLVLLSGISILSYDALSGTVYADDATNLSNIRANQIFVDVEGNELQIKGGTIDVPGSKQFLIEPQSSPDISGPGEIKSSINFEQHEKRGNIEGEKLLLGVHTEERLLTISLYILVKYFLTSRKKDLIERGFQLATYSGSDFTRNVEYAEPVFSRYLTVSGMTQNDWLSDKVIPIESIDAIVLVDKDVADNEALNREDQTIQVPEDDES